VNLDRLTLGGRIVAIAGLLFFIDSFLPWFRRCVDLGAFGGKICGSQSGWDRALSLLATLLVIALVVHVALELAGTQLPPLGSITWAQVQLGVAAVAGLFVLLQFLIGVNGLNRSFGAYLGLLLAAAIVYGAVLRYREPAVRPFQPGPNI
jgi:hypothetical protein